MNNSDGATHGAIENTMPGMVAGLPTPWPAVGDCDRITISAHSRNSPEVVGRVAIAADDAGDEQGRCREVAGSKTGKWGDFRSRAVLGAIHALIGLLGFSRIPAGGVPKEQG